MKEFIILRAKTYSYWKNNNGEDKNKRHKKNCSIKRKLKFQDYEKCLEVAQTENGINH